MTEEGKSLRAIINIASMRIYKANFSRSFSRATRSPSRIISQILFDIANRQWLSVWDYTGFSNVQCCCTWCNGIFVRRFVRCPSLQEIITHELNGGGSPGPSDHLEGRKIAIPHWRSHDPRLKTCDFSFFFSLIWFYFSLLIFLSLLNFSFLKKKISFFDHLRALYTLSQNNKGTSRLV